MRTDPTTLKFNQVCIVAVSVAALAMRMPWLVAALAAVMLLGSVNPRAALFKLAWERAVRPALRLAPRFVDDDPRAHHFAQGVGGVFLAVAALAWLAGAAAVGVTLTLLVIALALLNLTTRVCVGCLMYFQYRQWRYRLSAARR